MNVTQHSNTKMDLDNSKTSIKNVSFNDLNDRVNTQDINLASSNTLNPKDMSNKNNSGLLSPTIGNKLNESNISVKTIKNKPESSVIDMKNVIEYLNSNENMNKNILIKIDIQGIHEFLFTS